MEIRQSFICSCGKDEPPVDMVPGETMEADGGHGQVFRCPRCEESLIFSTAPEPGAPDVRWEATLVRLPKKG